MSLHAVDAVEVHCDGCGERYDDDEFTFFLRDQVADWIGNSDAWKIEDGGYYCCGWATPKGHPVAGCWPPSWRDEAEK